MATLIWLFVSIIITTVAIIVTVSILVIPKDMEEDKFESKL